jgi:hypothetical protein
VRAPARFTEQLVALVVPTVKEGVMALHDEYGVSQASVMRAIINEGLPRIKAKLASGALDPSTLA